jgi:hypothetical protein
MLNHPRLIVRSDAGHEVLNISAVGLLHQLLLHMPDQAAARAQVCRAFGIDDAELTRQCAEVDAQLADEL